MQQFLLNIHAQIGDTSFIGMMITIGLFLSLYVIPYTTDVMVNSAAGLAEKHLGKKSRTLVINCSTNNPELITMLLALFLLGARGAGGIATPLGSNFANIYLMFFVGLFWVSVTMRFRDRAKYHRFMVLLGQEWKIVVWHLTMAIGMFVLARFSYNCLPDAVIPSARPRLILVTLLCVIGVMVYLWRESILKKQRPELFEDIDDEDHVASWRGLFLGTTGLMFACFIVNAMFLASSVLYTSFLSKILGTSIFAAMHYFLGALITSLPELNVAVANYRKVTSADLNTGLASASASNMSNLAIAGIGALIACL